MKARLNVLSWDECKKYIEKKKEIKTGTYDPLSEYIGIVRRRNRKYYCNTLCSGVTTSIIVAVGLGAGLSLTPLLAVFSGGSILAFVLVLALDHWIITEHDIEHGDIGEYLTDKELRELNDLCLSLKPTTERGKRALKRIQEICDEYLEIEEDEDNKPLNLKQKIFLVKEARG